MKNKDVNRPTLISLDGPDRVGKSTQVSALRNSLESMGYKVRVVKTPASSLFFGEKISDMLSSGDALKYPTKFQVMSFINRLDCYFEYILPLIEDHNIFKCDYVILDRWKPTMVAYGEATGANGLATWFMNKVLPDADLSLILLGEMFETREHVDAYDADHSLQARVRKNFDILVKSKAYKNCFRINAQNSIDNVHFDIISALFALKSYGKIK